MKLSQIIVQSVRSVMADQGDDGSFSPGHNGPYYDAELPIRNTAHVLILLLKAYGIDGDKAFLEAALKALDYIRHPDRRPMGATFWIRKKPEKDFSNGLIGQAWVIEALVYAAEILGQSDLIDLAEEVFLLHPFNGQSARWRVVNVDGSYDPVDMTFNHQLWFAAAGSCLQNNSEVQKQVRKFLDKLDTNLGIYPNGLIVHALGGQAIRRLTAKQLIKKSIKKLVKHGSEFSSADPVVNKAIGYHAFNTYAFAVIYKNMPDHVFWKSDKFARILNFVRSDFYKQGLDRFVPDPAVSGEALPFNRFGYAYNPPGIEVAYTLEVFSDYFDQETNEAYRSDWLNRQLERTLDNRSCRMSIQTDDSATLTARLYEAVRLSDLDLENYCSNAAGT